VRDSRRPHPLLVVLLVITLAYGGVATWRRANRPPGRWVGITDCAWRGAPRVTIRPGQRAKDYKAPVAHQNLHLAQCRQHCPQPNRWRTVMAASNLALETPAYCAGARSRVNQNHDTIFIRATIVDDMMAAMADVIDSVAIKRSIARECPEFLRSH
jgi:hypothetical protein